MICPEGYVSFRSLMDERPSKLFNAIKKEQKWVMDTFGPNYYKFIAFLGQEGIEDKLERLLLWAVEGELRIFHPEKGIFKLNTHSFESPNAEQVCMYFDIMDREISDDFHSKYNLIHPDMAKEYCSDDQDVANNAWQRTLESESSSHLLFNHFNLSWWHERQAYALDFTVYDILKKYPADGVELTMFDGTVNLLRPFAGAALCVPEWYMEERFEGKVEEIIEQWNLNHEFSKPKSERGRGRPNIKLQKFKDAYRVEYPEGHGDENKGSVLSKIISRAGCDGSIQTLDRAIREIEDEAANQSP